MENFQMPRIRTISQCVEEIKNIDRNSAVSEWYIRKLCEDNKIINFRSGCKILVNFDDLLNYFNLRMGVY